MSIALTQHTVPTRAEQQAKDQSFTELLNGATDAVIAMHHRDFYNAADVSTKYLGRDVLGEQRRQEFEALPQPQKDKMERNRDYGIYGLFHLVSRPEVHLALTLAAHEIYPERGALEARHRENLSRPGTAEAISARFPEMSPKRIANILALKSW